MSSTSRVVFLGRNGCVNTPVLLENLKAVVESAGVDISITEVEQTTLPTTDPRRGYPTPTILFDGNDLFGLGAPEPPYEPSCRIYPGGVPSSSALEEQLLSRLQSSD